MFTLEIIKTDLENNTQFLKNTIADIPEKILLQEPGPDQWSIHTILDHLRVTDKGVYRLCKTEATPTDRSPMLIINQMKEKFKNRDVKLPAPKTVLPYYDGKSKDELILELEEIRSLMIDQGEALGWHEVLDGFPHPITGTMTRLEWLYFSIYHTERHILQIDSTLSQLKIG